MKLYIPVMLKMAYNPFKPINTCNQNPQKDDSYECPFDKVVDPLTEFHVPITSHNKSPNDAYNLPRRAKRKSSSTSLYSKLEYNVDRNELPRVHRTLSNQSLANSAKDVVLTRNILTSNSLDFGSFNNIHILPSNSLNYDTVSTKSDISDAVTPVPELPNLEISTLQNVSNDKFETSSNISISSNITDVPCSILSSISDFDEVTCTNKNISAYEITIKELRDKLEETQAQNETYKFALKDLEWKTELNWQAKYQELLRQKAHCDGQLKTVQIQHENLLKEREKNLLDTKKFDEKNALFEEYTRLQTKLNNIEKINSDLNSKLILSFNECKQFHSQNSKIESENEKLRVNLQEMKIDLDSKNTVLHGLKNKITEQHIELQNQIQAKLKLNNFVASLNNEIESVKKSEKWYVDQLHSCQYAKSKIQQELMSTQSNLITNNQKLETFKLEIKYWKNLCEETGKKAMREKEKLLRKMEVIEADLIERHTLVKRSEEKTETDHSEYKNIAENLYNETENKLLIEEYEEKLSNFNKIFKEKDLLLNSQTKQNADYLVRLTTLQKMLNEKELHYQMLENTNNDLEMKCNAFNENIRTKDNQLLELRNKIVHLEVSLHAANREKEEIDEVIKNVREDFNKFMKCYNNIKETLEEKSKIINNFECEKQELFMENNWRVCEIEELQQKILTSKGTQAELMELKNLYNEAMDEKEIILEENNALKIKIDGFENENKISNDENGEEEVINNEEILKLKETLNIREDQLFNQTQNCELLNNEIKEKEKQIVVLKQQIKQLELTSKNENFKTTELKDINMALEVKIQELNKKILDSNSVIEQFNTLCRNSELEKHDLALQLEFIKKEKLLNGLKNEEIINVNKPFVNFGTQTENKDFNINLENIKSKLNEMFVDNNNYDLNLDEIDMENIFIKINEYLNIILELKKSQANKIELSEKVIKTLKNKLFVYKNKIQEKVIYMEGKCYNAMQNYEEIKNKLDVVYGYIKSKNNCSSVEIQTDNIDNVTDEIDLAEVKETKTLQNTEESEKYKKSEKTKRTLLRKVKEELRSRKTAEKNLASLQETYDLAITEINNLKIINNRTEIEFETLKSRCNEYKEICDKQNETIVSLETEKGENASRENIECVKCVELKKLKEDFYEIECKFKTVKDKLFWYEKEINDKEQGITECKKQLFNEKLHTSALKKQVSSIQMCLDNANSLLDTKQVEFSQLKLVCEKLETSKMDLADQLETEQTRYQEAKRKLDENLRDLDERTAKDDILADEIKTISCHLHQKNLELSDAESRIHILENEYAIKIQTLQNTITELQTNLTEIQNELETVRNDKFFLQRLCADLKMSLQGTINQNKVLQLRLANLQAETNNINNKIQLDSSLTSSKIDDEYITRLLKESTVVPDRPLLSLRSCLDSLKTEMAILQQEIIAKTQNNVSF